MNINVIGKEGYYATVIANDGVSWEFTVSEDHGTVFSLHIANEILSWANAEYKKGCPKGYWKEGYDPNRVFIKLKYNMTDYRKSVSLEGDEIMVPAGTKKIGTYDKNKNVLRIWEDGMPVYENNNGVICKDKSALADSLM